MLKVKIQRKLKEMIIMTKKNGEELNSKTNGSNNEDNILETKNRKKVHERTDKSGNDTFNDEKTNMKDKKAEYNDALEQITFIKSLRERMILKENAMNRIKSLLTNLKKVKNYICDDLKNFNKN